LLQQPTAVNQAPEQVAVFRFYEELNDFLPRQRRKTAFAHHFRNKASVKDMIESLGVPHTEIDLILVNGESVGFDYAVRNGDRLSVYPVFEAMDIAPLVRLRPEPLRQIRFVLDTHLGKLARRLRLLGFDSLYGNCWADDYLAQLSTQGPRILLTRDIGLLKRSQVAHGMFVRNTEINRQVAEIVSRLQLDRRIRPFTRCMRCNGALIGVPAQAVATQVPKRVLATYKHFCRCADCSQIYWQGSHYRQLKQKIEHLGLDQTGAARAQSPEE